MDCNTLMTLEEEVFFSLQLEHDRNQGPAVACFDMVGCLATSRHQGSMLHQFAGGCAGDRTYTPCTGHGMFHVCMTHGTLCCVSQHVLLPSGFSVPAVSGGLCGFAAGFM